MPLNPELYFVSTANGWILIKYGIQEVGGSTLEIVRSTYSSLQAIYRYRRVNTASIKG